MNGDEPTNRISAIEKPKVKKPSRQGNKSVEQTHSSEFNGKVRRRRSGRGLVLRALVRLSIFVLIIVALVGVLLTTFFSSASVEITLKEQTVEVDGSYTGKKESDIGSQPTYIITESIEIEDTVAIPADGSKEVNLNATGKVTIINAISKTPIRLKATTRFETEDGLIYRTPKRTTVPALKVVDGNEVPGTIEVEIFADAAGEEYNIGPTTFRFPGLKEAGDLELYAKLTARSDASIKGGFSGTRFVAEDTLIESARNRLREKLKTKAEDIIKTTTLDGALIFDLDDTLFITYESVSQTDNKENESIILRERATARALAFNEAVLIGLVTRNINFDETPQTFLDYNSLDISFEEDLDDPDDLEDIEFTLNGSVKLGWSVNENKLIDEIKGKKLSNIPNILSTFPSIESGEASVFPSWKSTIPDDPDSISVSFTEGE
ncbi:MAG: hypothetical protein OXU73_01790 [Candidatus Campbellbacteria bacterium]|nr:hypothetical protein [Candidatus Campbellbacteria bacterium]